jgi:hypothetical protein
VILVEMKNKVVWLIFEREDIVRQRQREMRKQGKKEKQKRNKRKENYR